MCVCVCVSGAKLKIIVAVHTQSPINLLLSRSRMDGLHTTRLHQSLFHIIRLLPGQDLLGELRRFVNVNKIEAAFIATVVGSVGKVTLRPAGLPDPLVIEDTKFEIVSLTGTLECFGACHLHMSVSDHECNVKGGHVLDGCIVRTTAEIVIGCLPSVKFERKEDERSGYEELFVTETMYEEQANNPSSLLAAKTRAEGEVFKVEGQVDNEEVQNNFGIFDIPYKMILVVNCSLGMGKGKIAAQCGHAVHGAYSDALRYAPSAVQWWENSGCAKIAVKADTDEVRTYPN